MQVRITMGEQDRDDYGGPAELVYDHERVLDLTADELEAIESETGHYVDTFCRAVGARARTAWVRRMMIWLARRQAGLKDPWERDGETPAFTPRLGRAQFVELDQEVAAGPPAVASTPPNS